MSTSSFVLPGEIISESQLPIPSNPNTSLKLGPGLRHVPPSTITTTTAGYLCTDEKKHTAWLEPSSGRYVPSVGDLIIAQILRSAGESFLCSITPYASNATLSHFAFPNASKKTRPQLASGAVVYARVALANKYFDPELECVSQSTGKADGLGELKGGMVFHVSPGFARRLMMGNDKGGIVVLEDFAAKIPFEVAIGRNGLIWIDSKGIKSTMMVGKALEETDKRSLDIKEQRSLVKRFLGSL
ncbi:MAG: exosome non-catalytic core subunit rrp40 [Vezdaea aestivalis]|nr:MAG: exosome non-catalytic core subunit rrp40 [Vezdaea aestivalis]